MSSIIQEALSTSLHESKNKDHTILYQVLGFDTNFNNLPIKRFQFIQTPVVTPFISESDFPKPPSTTLVICPIVKK